ncbi:hypothetical protein [Oceanobacillus jeddahense]|uniref:Uncharacterized protein n=1 Tax=Oceanobacillus jeddahense TaxID=1462527 RepID=A0ABY5JL54_9BACI|nr:hypothetical protein [Oceanobacillus jeddahense]UUI01040.1 hypothetical protein NP439_13235 [Oceanobacillus jeddahense]
MHLSLLELLLIFIGGVLILGIQFYLSTRKNRLMGLLFPFVSLGYSIYMFLKSDFFSDMALSMKAYMFIAQNIPAIILLVIYFICRWNMKKTRES